jgi:hypothetical protein
MRLAGAGPRRQRRTDRARCPWWPCRAALSSDSVLYEPSPLDQEKEEPGWTGSSVPV